MKNIISKRLKNIKNVQGIDTAILKHSNRRRGGGRGNCRGYTAAAVAATAAADTAAAATNLFVFSLEPSITKKNR